METATLGIVHTPVLPEETLRLLAPEGGEGWMIDATLGEGGHSEAFLSRFPALRVTGVDADSRILAVAGARLKRFGDRITYYPGWAEDVFKQIREGRGEAFWRGPGASDESPPGSCKTKDGVLPEGARLPAVILMDLGVSLYHYEKGDRGFSFRKDEPLDMRIDRGRGRSAARLIASLREDELAALLWQNAGERHSRRIARAVALARREAPVERSGALAEIVFRAVPPRCRRGPLHPATRTFQALRIAVNGELEYLEARLEAAFAALAPGGRLGVISFHSGEDRIVKRCFRALASKPRDAGGRTEARLLTKKPVEAGDAEARENPPSRSAKLRAIEKDAG